MFDSYIAALHAAALEEKSERRAQRQSACRPVQQESPLLDLPPELRNEIYRYTLHASDWLVVDGRMPEEPGLLSACRQIRTEASPIYYFENWFHIWINDYNGEVTWLLRKKWWVYKRPLLFRVEMQAFAKPNWPNLTKWLKEYHGAWYLGFAADGQVWAAVQHVLHGWFLMVKEARDLPWETVERLILCQRKALVALDERWGLDEDGGEFPQAVGTDG